MSFIFIFFLFLIAILLLPAVLLPQEKKLIEVDQSLKVRLVELKKEYKIKARQLLKLLENGDLAKEEWQNLNAELDTNTAESIEYTTQYQEMPKSSVSLLTAISIIILIAGVAFAGFYFSSRYDSVDQYLEINRDIAKNGSDAIQKLRQKSNDAKTQDATRNYYIGLRSIVEQQPTDSQNWLELAAFNSQFGRTEEAQEAINKAIALDPNNIDLQIEKSRIAIASNDKNLKIQAIESLRRISISNPDNQSAKLLLGSNAFSLGFFKMAIDNWQAVLDGMLPDDPNRKSLELSIAKAKQNLSNKPQAQENNLLKTLPSQDIVTADSKSQSGIIVKLNVPESIKENLRGDEAIFVFAKSTTGPSAPLAVVRTQLNKLSEEIVVSDKNSMQSEFLLSSFPKVRITARISISGDAISQAGDYQAISRVLSAPYNNQIVELEIIDQVEGNLPTVQKQNQTTGVTSTKLNSEGAAILLNLTMSDQLQKQANPNHTVFVFAKAVGGPKPPLAVVKLKVSDLPTVIKLSDQNAMQATFKLSNFDKVIVTARISKSGEPTAQVGDVEVQSKELLAPFANTEIKLQLKQ